MKLIDILVQDLPGLGGWPDGIDDIEMLSDGTIYFNGDIAPDNYKLTQCSDGWSRLKSAKDYSNAVTREQYEAALAASKTEWDGVGLPPVGCECEIKRIADWMPVTIRFISDYHTIFTTFGGTEDCYQTCSLRFRPIRSEADKKRDEIIEALKEGLGHAHGLYDLMQIYHLLNNGKIPHIRID